MKDVLITAIGLLATDPWAVQRITAQLEDAHVVRALDEAADELITKKHELEGKIAELEVQLDDVEALKCDLEAAERERDEAENDLVAAHHEIVRLGGALK